MGYWCLQVTLDPPIDLNLDPNFGKNRDFLEKIVFFWKKSDILAKSKLAYGQFKWGWVPCEHLSDAMTSRYPHNYPERHQIPLHLTSTRTLNLDKNRDFLEKIVFFWKKSDILAKSKLRYAQFKWGRVAYEHLSDAMTSR